MSIKKRQPKIRFGIMCENTYFSKWQADTITKLLKNKNIKCHLLIINESKTFYEKLKYIIKKIKFKNIFWLAFSFYSENISKTSRQINLTPLLKNVSIIECHTIKKGKYSEYFSDNDVLKIKRSNLDFILKFEFGIIRGKILKAAKYGVWSFHHGDEEKYRGGPPCFWEIYKNNKVTGSILQRLTDKLDAGIVLKKGFLKTKYSYIKNRDQMYLESSRWPTQVCVDILHGKTNYFNGKPSATNAPVYYAPTNLQFTKFLLQANLRNILSLFRLLFWVSNWNIGVVDKPIHSFIQKNNHQTTKWFPNFSKKKYLADPFALADKNKLHIFFEELTYKEKKGNISYVCYKNGQFTNKKTIIKEPFHLSYPYLFKYNGDCFIIPESYETNKVFLYKATNFPLKWKRERILLDNFAGLDNTLFRHNGTWWLFSSNRYDCENSNLYLFYSDSLFGKWKPHPQNPIKIDVRSARAAGTPFKYKGVLYRPAMDCSEKYGGSITINKILIMTKTDYQEIEHAKVQPGQNISFPNGIHTLCQAGKSTVIDGCKDNFILTDINLLRFVLNRAVCKLRSKDDMNYSISHP